MAETRYQNPKYNYGTAAPKLQPRPLPQQYEHDDTNLPRRRTRNRSGLIRALFLFAVATAIIGSCIFLLSVRSEITSTGKKITTLQSELQQVRADNDAKEVTLNKSIDLTNIYNVATTELGMTYPSEENVIFYHRSDGGYVRQYEQIPTN